MAKPPKSISDDASGPHSASDPAGLDKTQSSNHASARSANAAKRQKMKTSDTSGPRLMSHQGAEGPARAPLKTRAQQTGSLIMATLGILATIGGVLGLVQFFQDRTPAAAEGGDQAQYEVISLLKNDKITGADAKHMLSMLANPRATVVKAISPKSVDTVREGLSKNETVRSLIPNIGDTESSRRETADLLMANYQTRVHGAALLEDNAKTSKDWQYVAERVYAWDVARAKDAARRAVQLDPENYIAWSILTQALIDLGDLEDARKKAMTAAALAESRSQKIIATATLARLHARLDDTAALQELRAELDVLLADGGGRSLDFSGEIVTSIDVQWPEFILASSLAETDWALERKDSALVNMQNAQDILQRVAASDAEHLPTQYRLIRLRITHADWLQSHGKAKKALTLFNKAFDDARYYSDINAASSETIMPHGYYAQAQALKLSGDMEGAGRALSRRRMMLKALIVERPGDVQISSSLKQATEDEVAFLRQQGRLDEAESLVQSSQ